MNTRALKRNMIIKNYKELCNILEEPVKAGKSKILQVKDFKRYFNYHRDGQKIIIDYINENPLPKEINKNSKYVSEIEDILINYIYNNKNENNEVILSFSKIINILGLVNNTYTIANSKKRELAEILKIQPEAVYFFYNNSRGEFKNIVERALKSMRSRKIIEFRESYSIAYKNKDGKLEYRVATDEQKDSIQQTEHYVLNNMELKTRGNARSIRDLFLSGCKKYAEFEELVMKELPNDWRFYYKVYILHTTDGIIKMEYDNIQSKRKQLNEKSVNRMNKKFSVTDGEINPEKELIDKLISLINYDVKLDNKVKMLYVKHNKDYYDKLKHKNKELIEIQQQVQKAKKEIEEIKDDYKNKNMVNDNNYYEYTHNLKMKKQHKQREINSLMVINGFNDYAEKLSS